MVRHTAFLPNTIASNTVATFSQGHGDVAPLLSPQTFDQISSSTSFTSSISIASQTSSLQPDQSFEPIAPDTSILIGFGIVVILSIIASFVWANEVVPVSRTKLALSKRDGDVKKYLDELKEGGDYNDASTNAGISGSTTDVSLETTSAATIDGKESTLENQKSNDGRDFERWLFTDWLENNKSAGKPGRKKEPALPILKNAKWNSGDNPVLVTFAMMMVGVLIASVTERTGGSF